MTPKKGTLERTMFDKLKEKGKLGVTVSDLVGTGIDHTNIDLIVSNLRTGMFESEDDIILKEDA